MDTNEKPRLIPAALQNSVAVLLLALVIAMAWMPAASCFTPPTIPTAPIPTVTITVPEAPTPSVPSVDPPQAPTPPETPAQPNGGGNCCLRDGPNVAKKCAGASTCCVKDYTSSGDCEDAKGFWFFSKEGCAGAC